MSAIKSFVHDLINALLCCVVSFFFFEKNCFLQMKWNVLTSDLLCVCVCACVCVTEVCEVA